MAAILPAVVGPGLLPGDYTVEVSCTKNRKDYASTWGILVNGAINIGISWFNARDLIKVDQRITYMNRKIDVINARAGAQSAMFGGHHSVLSWIVISLCPTIYHDNHGVGFMMWSCC